MTRTSLLAIAAAVALPGLAHAAMPMAHPVSPTQPVIRVADEMPAMADITVGDLVIVSPYARATPPNAPVSGGYMVIRNTGTAPDRLVGGAVDFAGKVEVHEMMMDGDVMKMHEVEGGLEIPPGGEVTLKPGGFHIMFMGMTEQLMEGETRDVKLRFQDAGEVTIPMPVRDIMGRPAMDSSMGSSGSMN